MSIGVFDLVAILTLLSASTLCIVAVTAILRLMKNVDRITYSVESVQHDVRAMRTAAMPALEQATKVLEQAHTTLTRVDGDLQKISAGADTFKAIADDVRGLETLMIKTIKPSLEELAEFVSSVVSGLTSVTRKFTKFLS
jgi:archaellum component FlaC